MVTLLRLKKLWFKVGYSQSNELQCCMGFQPDKIVRLSCHWRTAFVDDSTPSIRKLFIHDHVRQKYIDDVISDICCLSDRVVETRPKAMHRAAMLVHR